jgi:predicted nuclease of predicted toxin-antitoxin system
MSGSPPAVTLIFDECVPDNVGDAVRAHNALGSYPIDAVHVGKVAALPKQTPDDQILEWAEQNGRVIVSRDRNTMDDG